MLILTEIYTGICVNARAVQGESRDASSLAIYAEPPPVLGEAKAVG
jgi:hypothetical protein